jgi:hypothetical protein
MQYGVPTPAGSLSVIQSVLLLDSTSFIGAGKTGLVFSTGSLTCYYKRSNANASVAVSLATATLGTWATGGFKEIDNTNMQGLYEFDGPNLAYAIGAKYVDFYFTLAGVIVPDVLRVYLTSDIPAVQDTVASASSSTVFVGGGTATLSTTNSAYNNMIIAWITGANAGLTSKVSAYVGSTTLQFTLVDALPTTPSAGDVYTILGRSE